MEDGYKTVNEEERVTSLLRAAPRYEGGGKQKEKPSDSSNTTTLISPSFKQRTSWSTKPNSGKELEGGGIWEEKKTNSWGWANTVYLSYNLL